MNSLKDYVEALSSDNILQRGDEIINDYTCKIVLGEFKFEEANINKGNVGNQIGYALRLLSNENKDLEDFAKYILLRPYVAVAWKQFEPMRFFLPNVWEEWKRFLRIKLY